MRSIERRFSNLQNKNFEVIHLAAALLCSGCTLISVREISGGLFTFIFEERPDQKLLVSNYWNGLMRIEPRQFANIVRDLKARTKVRNVFIG